MSLVSSRIALWNSKSSQAAAPSKPSNTNAASAPVAGDSAAKSKRSFFSIFGKTKANTSTPQPPPADLLSAHAAPPAAIQPSKKTDLLEFIKPKSRIDALFPTAKRAPSRLSDQELQSTVCVIGAPKSGASTVSELVKARIDSKTLPFSALLDSTDVFYTEEHTYFGRMGLRTLTVDHRATMMAQLAALIFVVDATDLSTAFQVPWKQTARSHGRTPYPRPEMSEQDPWLPQMVAGHLDVLIGKPVLILCNKSDLPNAKTAEQVRERLLASDMQGVNIRVQECIAHSGIGVTEGMAWVHQQVLLKQNQAMLDKLTSFDKTKSSTLAETSSSATSSERDSSGVWIGKLSFCLGFSKSSSSFESTSGKSSPIPEVEKTVEIMNKPASSGFGFHSLLSAAKVIV